MSVTENLILGEFPKNVLDQANAASRIRTASFLAYRLDLRGKTILSFSDTPETPTECAYSLYRNGLGWKLGIHVADVCEYVCEGSPLDAEARKRRASVLSGFTKSNMLPDNIVSDLCNLSQKGDKLAISVLLDIDSNLKVTNVEVEESIIRTAKVCVYSEIDQLQMASDESSVMLLRTKYSPYMNIFSDMYELAARLCMRRVERGGLDCTYFRRVYERNNEGKITVFRRESEPDSRAMLREIGYFTAEALGNYMSDNGLPCIFNGRRGVAEETLNYLSKLVSADDSSENSAKRTAIIADLAKGTPYYSFVCDALAANVPSAQFSTEPIPNAFCASNYIISFFNPVSHYTDLLIQRVLKTAINAKNPQNLNLNRQRKIVADAAAEANNAEQFVYSVRKDFATESALEFIENNIADEFVGFPVRTEVNGDILVLLECGIFAYIPSELAEGYEYKPAHPAKFGIVKVGADHNSTKVKPLS